MIPRMQRLQKMSRIGEFGRNRNCVWYRSGFYSKWALDLDDEDQRYGSYVIMKVVMKERRRSLSHLHLSPSVLHIQLLRTHPPHREHVFNFLAYTLSQTYKNLLLLLFLFLFSTIQRHLEDLPYRRKVIQMAVFVRPRASGISKNKLTAAKSDVGGIGVSPVLNVLIALPTGPVARNG